MEENTNKTSEISIIDICMMLLSHWMIIVITALVFGAVLFTYTKLTYVPRYTSSGTMYVDSKSASTRSDISGSEVNASQSMIPTYIEILGSKSFLEVIESDVDGKYSTGAIKGMMSLKAMNETNLVKVSVSAVDAHDAYVLCSSILSHAPDELTRVIAAGSVKIVDVAEESRTPQPSGAAKKGMIGFVAGAAIACLFIFLRELLDSRIKSSEDLSNRFDLPVLGDIPEMRDDLKQ